MTRKQKHIRWLSCLFTGVTMIVTGTLWPWPGVGAEKEPVKAEVWFQCEFAHSKIPPDDDCRMLDDDGFLVVEDIIYHVKVSDSEETTCRGNRIGHCFLRPRPQITVDGDEIGSIVRTSTGFAVDFLGCTQHYKMTPQANFVKVAPDQEQCYWTPDKNYYVARYKGRLISTDN